MWATLIIGVRSAATLGRQEPLAVTPRKLPSCHANSHPAVQAVGSAVLVRGGRPSSANVRGEPFLKVLVRRATGERLANRLPNLGLKTPPPLHNSGALALRMGPRCGPGSMFVTISRGQGSVYGV